MPIVHEIYKVLFENKPPLQAVKDLMGRELKKEV
jgi:glycerol-3-phosphate dehydrogenase